MIVEVQIQDYFLQSEMFIEENIQSFTIARYPKGKFTNIRFKTYDDKIFWYTGAMVKIINIIKEEQDDQQEGTTKLHSTR